ncbi:hypothetical protein ACFQO7_26190 [Catellatospora aurea]|uniref:Serine/threonine protein kinase n=1 Tax=Catellatospora aurea TaxID=1337874 RepID=A0ABW2H6M8_9ACTN
MSGRLSRLSTANRIALVSVLVALGGLLVTVLAWLQPQAPSSALPAGTSAVTTVQPSQVTASTAPGLTTLSPASPSPTSPPSHPGELPAAFVGTWTGAVFQTNTGSEYQATFKLYPAVNGDVVGESEYPSLRCAGRLQLKRSFGGTEVHLTETLVKRGTCVSGIVKKFRLSGADEIFYFWSFNERAGYDGQGTLKRMS